MKRLFTYLTVVLLALAVCVPACILSGAAEAADTAAGTSDRQTSTSSTTAVTPTPTVAAVQATTDTQTQQTSPQSATDQKVADAQNQDAAAGAGTAFVPGEAVVVFKEGTSTQAADSTLQSTDKVDTKEVSGNSVTTQTGNVAATVKVSDTASVAEAVDDLSQKSDVETVQPNYIYKLCDSSTDDATSSYDQDLTAQTASVSINDTYKGNEWYLDSIGAYSAWSTVTCSRSVGVAVLDTGIDLNHEDLRNNIAGAYDATLSGSVTDVLGHGTHVAGIVAAQSNNGVGTSGVSYNATIVPIKVVNTKGYATTSSMMRGYTYLLGTTDADGNALAGGQTVADRYNVHVINMSLGGAGTVSKDGALEKQIDKAASEGILTVCSAGNENTDSTVYPGDYDTCMSVIALDSNDKRASYSNYGYAKDISAPGDWIYSTTYDGAYGNMSGTSMASPIVAGVAALVYACDDSLSVAQVKGVLTSTATNLGSSYYYGAGKVNAAAAVQKVASVTISGSNTALLGKSTNYSATTAYADDLTWSVVSRGGKASISSGGVLKATASGTVRVIARSKTHPNIYAYKDVTISDKVVRLAGNSALDTMEAIVNTSTSNGAGGTVIVATIGGYWDALTASGLAGLCDDAPILMTDGTSLSPTTRSEIQRIDPTRVIICGGTTAVSDTVAAQIRDVTGRTPVRYSGANATATACQIFNGGKSYGSWGNTAFVATINSFQDALSIAPYAYANKSPIFLTEGNGTLSDSTLSTIRSSGIKNIYIVGGTAVVSSDVPGQLKGIGVTNVGRLAGDTAGGTSNAIAEWELDHGMTCATIGTATIDSYYDALCGASLCGKNNQILVLVSDGDRSALNGVVNANSSTVDSAYVFGGPAAVSPQTANYLNNKMG